MHRLVHAGRVSPFVVAPIEPAFTRWELPSPGGADSKGFVAIGADLEPGTLLSAYRAGLFPMPIGRRDIGWWSPDPRGILPLDGLKVSKSLRQSCKRYDVRFDTDFRAVMTKCGNPKRPNGWINRSFIDAYERLHHSGWAHSVEAYDGDGTLVGGLYGVKIGALFAGESMFSDARDASKVALVSLVGALHAAGTKLLDVQWTTPHLISLGAVDVARDDYLVLLDAALRS